MIGVVGSPGPGRMEDHGLAVVDGQRHGARQRQAPGLIEAANKLIHRQGFNQTTLADIARESEVPLGNVYYYFRTKEEIGSALIEHRANFYRDVIESWKSSPYPLLWERRGEITQHLSFSVLS